MMKTVAQFCGLFIGVVGGSLGVNLIINKFKGTKQSGPTQNMSTQQAQSYQNPPNQQKSMYDNISLGLSSPDSPNRKI